ncbi:Tetratricopeptide repeat family [Favolaschia claudopus]|uniref:Tetratricopeptide repeat family n=1 Tax=Favolaschia claudopus TaxID=2862362 RepID=A0AAV9Z687_9AGAR
MCQWLRPVCTVHHFILHKFSDPGLQDEVFTEILPGSPARSSAAAGQGSPSCNAICPPLRSPSDFLCTSPIMDPITVTTTIITLGTFIKDLIELGEGISSSMEQVSENRRQIRNLTEDIVRALYELASLTRGKEGAFRGPELLCALESLKAEMLCVHSKCLKISPKQLPGFRGIPSHLKAWRKRDELEKQIGRLRERVQNCISQFTAFSAARTEHLAAETAHRTLRIEKRLIVDNIENQVKARRLEGLMARVMLDSEFGHCRLRETAENISATVDCIRRFVALSRLEIRHIMLPIFRLFPIHAFACTLPHSRNHCRDSFPGSCIVTGPVNEGYYEQLDLSMCFAFAGMYSEEIVWGHFKIDLLRYMAKRGYDNGTLPRMANTLSNISGAHRCRSELDIAIELSQQSLALWVEISHLLPEADNRIGYLESMLAHVKNFIVVDDDKTTMLSAAQDAVSLARPMAKALAESMVSRGTSLTTEEESNTDIFCEAFFVLAKVLSSLNRPVDSYEVFVEAFRTASSLPILNYDRNWRHDIDSFLHVICTVAEDGRLSLSMLADCVDLFHTLTRIYQKQYSFGFLHVLHAFVYSSQQPHSYHSTQHIRLFLEPTYPAAPPAIDIATSIPIDSSVLADAMRLFFADLWDVCTIPLIQNILVAHFSQAIEVLRATVQSSVFDNIMLSWVLPIASAALPRISPAQYVALLRVLVEGAKCKSSYGVPDTWTFEQWEMYLAKYFQRVCKHAARFGVVNEGISIGKELQVFLALWAILPCDAARFRDAVDLVKRKGLRYPGSGDLAPDCWSWYYLWWVIKEHILRRVGRHKEALQLVRKGVAEGIEKFWTHGPTFHLHLFILLSQLACARQQIGRPAKALEHAEKVVAVCQDVYTEDTEEDEVLCVQIHSRTIHSNCLATVGRTAEGLESAQQAVSLYTECSEHLWKNFLFTIRGQELGGNAFFALSLRLLTVNDNEEALLNGRRATELYRKLVELAPRHLPTLARSLRHLAAILWLLGQQDEAIAAFEEAVDILRKVVGPETYFLPLFGDALDELAGYLTKRGDSTGASTATSEAAAARLKFSSLPPEPEWLFMQVVDGDEDDDLNWWEWGAEQYHDALESLVSTDSADSEVDESDVAGDPEFEDALDTASTAKETEEPASAGTSEGKLSPLLVAPGDTADQPSFQVEELNDKVNSGTATAAGEAAKGTEIQGTFANILSKPVEIRLSMRSTVMDFLWWILLLLPATLFAVMYAQGIRGL